MVTPIMARPQAVCSVLQQYFHIVVLLYLAIFEFYCNFSFQKLFIAVCCFALNPTIHSLEVPSLTVLSKKLRVRPFFTGESEVMIIP